MPIVKIPEKGNVSMKTMYLIPERKAEALSTEYLIPEW